MNIRRRSHKLSPSSTRCAEGSTAITSVHATIADPSQAFGKLRLCICFGVLLSIICLHAACKSGKSERDSVAAVDGEKIYFDEFNQGFKAKLNLVRKSAGYNEGQILKLKREYLDEMIDEKLMLRRARQAGIVVSDQELEKRVSEIKADYPNDGFSGLFKDKAEFQAWREELRKRMVFEKLIEREVNAGLSVSDEEARAYFNSHPTGWTAQDSVRVSQIVLPDRQKAEETLKRLKKGEDFALLAKERSTGPEGAKGGDLGVFAKGVLPEHFDRVIFSLEAGTFSGIVETPYGFHIFKVLERIKKRSADFTDANLKIKEKLKREKEEKAYELWLANLRSKASITLNQAVLERAGQQH